MKTINKQIILILFCFISCGLYSQEQDSLAIMIKSNPKENEISLRWVATTPDLWDKLNKVGYTLERYTIKRNGEILKAPEKILLSKEPIKPAPLDKWENIVNNNDIAAIIAQTLYGEKFELTGNDAQGFMRVVNESRELEQRFMMAVYAADLDFESACLAGWGWTDKTVKQNEEYLYRIIPASSISGLSIKEGNTYTSTKFHEELPAPAVPLAVWGDLSVDLSWNYDRLLQYYVAYHIEKSEDGKNFYRISDIPITNITGNRMAHYIDDLSENEKTYYYRLRGVSSFGETGPASEIISGVGHTALQAVPVIISTYVNKEGEVEIKWEFDRESNSLIKGFELRRSDQFTGTYKPVKTGISPTARELIYEKPEPVNYFSIAAIPLHGQEKVSLSVLVQPVDSIPPAVPTGLKGEIDSLGVVTLTWNANQEKDLFGYRVFRSFIAEDEKIQLNDLAHQSTTFYDTVSVKNLNSKIYYSVAALDFHYNQSEHSEPIVLTKPDFIPPTASVISAFKAAKEGNILEWINSSSDDFAKTKIYRTEEKGEFSVVAEIPKNQTHVWIDNDTEYGKTYRYALKAEDESGLESDFSPEISIRAISETTAGVSVSLEKQPEQRVIIIKWKVKPANMELHEIQIYKKTSQEVLSMWRSLSPWETSVVDSNLQVGEEYSYMVRIIPKNGKAINSEINTITF
jgi:hypothetical protein